MEYDLNTGTVYARGTLDTLTGEVKGQPAMKEGNSTYTMEELRYNFNTRKARITNMITQQEEGLLHGKNIKMLPDRSINITKGQYSVCDLEHPHYYLALTAAKVITKPSQKTVFGPAYPVIEDVPLPIGLPFGFIPKRPSRATGLLMPTFGEENSRGFYLRDLGMYFVFGNYLDLSITGDIYTLGSWAVNVNSRYKVNYKRNGNFAMNISNDQTGERGSTDFFQIQELRSQMVAFTGFQGASGNHVQCFGEFLQPFEQQVQLHICAERSAEPGFFLPFLFEELDGRFNLSIMR